jgi:hypothetical protein
MHSERAVRHRVCCTDGGPRTPIRDVEEEGGERELRMNRGWCVCVFTVMHGALVRRNGYLKYGEYVSNVDENGRGPANCISSVAHCQLSGCEVLELISATGTIAAGSAVRQRPCDGLGAA